MQLAEQVQSIDAGDRDRLVRALAAAESRARELNNQVVECLLTEQRLRRIVSDLSGRLGWLLQ
jgi:hypothetical protein